MTPEQREAIVQAAVHKVVKISERGSDEYTWDAIAQEAIRLTEECFKERIEELDAWHVKLVEQARREEREKCDEWYANECQGVATKARVEEREKIREKLKRWGVPEDEFAYIAKCKCCDRPCMEVTEPFCILCGEHNAKSKELLTAAKSTIEDFGTKNGVWVVAHGGLKKLQEAIEVAESAGAGSHPSKPSRGIGQEQTVLVPGTRGNIAQGEVPAPAPAMLEPHTDGHTGPMWFGKCLPLCCKNDWQPTTCQCVRFEKKEAKA